MASLGEGMLLQINKIHIAALQDYMNDSFIDQVKAFYNGVSAKSLREGTQNLLMVRLNCCLHTPGHV